MADTKISALAAVGTLHSDDLLVDVDVHDTTMAASGTDKKLTVNQLIGGATSGQVVVCNSSGIPVGASSILQGANNQLNLPEISTPGTQVSGDKWTDATQHCAATFDGSATSADCLTGYHSRLIYIQNAKVTVATTSGATSLVSTTSATGTVSFPAGFLNVANRTIRVTARGYATSAATVGNNWLTLKLGSNIIASQSSAASFAASLTNFPWSFNADITVKATGSSGKLDTQGFSVFPNSNTNLVAYHMGNATVSGTEALQTQVALDLTAAYVFDLQINSTNANNTWVLTNLTLEALG